MLSLVFAALMAAAMAAPQSIQMMKIIPSRHVPEDKVFLSYEPYGQVWEEFKQTHGKQYETNDEEKNRFSIFMKHVKFIEKHNSQYANGTKSYYLGINQFADMENWEYLKYNGLRARPSDEPHMCNTTYLSPNNIALPMTVDWRTKGYVTPIKNQKNCGSCWSFSTTGSLEGQHFRKTHQLKSLSEQQLVDCAGKFGNQGCNGGIMDYAFEYIQAVGGIETEMEYPYEARDDKCRFVKSETAATVSGCVDVAHDEQSLQEAVATIGPISVAIDASHTSFQLYSGGVYYESECSSTRLDHGVLAVGYGYHKGSPYWLVKNSWGTTWGMEGYIMMSRNEDNMCGIATMASYPLV